MTIKYEVLSTTVITGEEYGAESLSELGGCSDNGETYGLASYDVCFDVSVINQEGDEARFKITFQPVERTNGLMNYSGYDMTTAGRYGCDVDESSELEEFCDYDTSVIDGLVDIATDLAKKELERLTD